MRKKIIAANWKMNQTVADAATYLDNFLIEVADEKRIDIVGRGWDEPISSDHEQNRRVEAQWFTLE